MKNKNLTILLENILNNEIFPTVCKFTHSGKKLLVFLSFLSFVMIHCRPHSKDTKQMRISTDTSAGFFLDIQFMDCDSLRKQSFSVSKSDTALFIPKHSENLIISLMNHNKTAMITVPLYLEGNQDVAFSLEDLNSSTLKGAKPNVWASSGTKAFSELWNRFFSSAFEKDKVPNDELIEELKTHKKNYPNNLMASFLLLQFDTSWQQTNEEIHHIENCPGLNIFFSKLDKFKKGKIHKLSDSYNQFMSDLDLNTTPLNDLKFDSFKQIKKINIYFWASWCSPCLNEFNRMGKKEFLDSTNFFISVDKYKENAIEVANSYHIKNLFITDSEWLRKYCIESIPTHISIDNNKKMINKF